MYINLIKHITQTYVGISCGLEIQPLMQLDILNSFPNIVATSFSATHMHIKLTLGPKGPLMNAILVPHK